MVILISILLTVIASFYIFKLTRGRWLLNPAPMFIVCNLILFFGSIQYIDTSIEADTINIIVSFAGICSFILGTQFISFAAPLSRKQAKDWLSSPIVNIESGLPFNILIGIIIVVSIFVGFMYYHAVGYNLFLNSIVSLISGHGLLEDIATLRLESYSGERYFAPGYVNQFKNMLLPLLVGYIGARYMLKRKKADLLMAIFLSPLAFIFILGTGQRSPFFLAMLILVVFFNSFLPRKLVRKMNISFLAIIFALFTLTSFILGRTVSTIGSEKDVIDILMGLPERIFSGNQLSSVVGFRYIYELPTQYGREWLSSIIGLLPGQGSGDTVASEVYRILFGSTRGTAPISLWGSIWYNFNAPGIFIVPFLLGIFYQRLYVRLIHGPKTLLRLLVYSAYSILLGVWFAGGPTTLANIGILAVLILHAIVIVWLYLNRKIFGLKPIHGLVVSKSFVLY